MAEPKTDTALRKPEDIEHELTILRARATSLHDDSTARIARGTGDAGTERDEAAAESWALKQKAKAAEIQVEREQRHAAEQEAEAVALEAKAAAEADPVMAQEYREDADTHRGYAQGHTQRAEAAAQRAKEATEQAVPLDEKVKEHLTSDDIGNQPQLMEEAADAIDVKVRFLEEALDARKEAYRLQEAGEQERAVEMAERAVAAQERADGIEPDYDVLDDDARSSAGLDPQGINPDDIEMDPPEDPNAVDPNDIEMDPPETPADGKGPDGKAPVDPAPADPPATEDPSEPPIDPSVQVDSDGDGLQDWAELRLGTDPNKPDSDGDKLTDGYEDTYRHVGIDPLVADGDKDGLDDGEELASRTDPTNPNTDGDQYDDGKDLFPTDPTNDGLTPTQPEPVPEIPDASQPQDYESEPAPPIDDEPAEDVPAEGADEMSDM